MKNFIRQYPSISIFILALFVRIAYYLIGQLIYPNGTFLFDSGGYYSLGENLFVHGVFTQSGEKLILTPDPSRTPVYPFLIYLKFLFDCKIFWLILLQQIMGALACVWLFKSMQLLFTNTAGYVAALLFCFGIPEIHFTAVLLTDSLFVSLLCLLLYCLVLYYKKGSIQYLFLLAALLGILVLLRPIALYLVLLLPILIWVYIDKKRNTKSALLLLALLIIFPWMQRNKNTFGEYFLSSITEINLLYHAAAGIHAEYENETIYTIQDRYRNVLLADLNFYETSATVEFRKRARAEFFSTVAAHPLIAVKHYVRNLTHFFIKPLKGYADIYFGKTTGTNPNLLKTIVYSLLAFQLLFGLVVLMGLYTGLLFFYREHANLLFPLLFIIGYFALLSSITEADARFRLPIIPFVYALSAIGISRWQYFEKT